LADDDLVMTQRIAASPDAVFEFLVDPEKMVRWMGVEVELDPTPGGIFQVDVNGSDVALGTYVEIDRPHRVVFTWGWKDTTEVPPGSSTVTFTLTSDGDTTVVELRHSGLPHGMNDQHSEGWGYFLPRLTLAAEG
jgi:uncharacterized protein YndB with AHSA1/START domain